MKLRPLSDIKADAANPDVKDRYDGVCDRGVPLLGGKNQACEFCGAYTNDPCGYVRRLDELNNNALKGN